MAPEPKTLQDAILYFSSAYNCLNYLAVRRWKDGKAVCPTCGSADVSFVASRRLWQCKTRHPKAQFSIKVGTIFQDSPITLDKWLMVMWQLSNCKNGASSYEMSRATGISQKSVWFMLQRIRLAMQDDYTGGTLAGEIEVDESMIGGKVRNMHKARKARAQQSGRVGDKTIVLGILERATEAKPKRVRTSVIKDRKKDTIAPEVMAHVEKGSSIYSDEFGGSWIMGTEDKYIQDTVNHLETYVNGNVHTNGLENFWSLLKRGISGAYVSVEPFHLFRYVDEQAFRFNTRKHANGDVITDGERFDMVVRQIVGKRLTWAQTIGKDGKKPAVA